ncbi:MAG TPA: cyclic nucleotide-binding domain-containing protein [Candidatus Eisenbacteria bacterium]|nr:cyclic nucleotide-binding domain-containing protein [Candidatus Eisenbacteria bacterium]
MSDSKIDHLSRVPLFSELSRRDLEFVASRTDEADVKAGEKLTTQGSPGETFYILLDGEAHVEVDGEPRRTLKAGDFFGEIGMLDRGPATASVTTSTPAKLLVMSHAQFRDAIKASDGLLVKVLTAMGQRLRADLAARHGHN